MQKRLFQEGLGCQELAKPCSRLTTPYKANLAERSGDLALSAEANLARASATARRYKALVEANAISKQEYDTAIANEKAALAQVETGKAAVHQCQCQPAMPA